MPKVFIIAEAGVNHNGDLNTAFRLVDKAAEAGADAVKFQSFKTEELAVKTTPKAKYQINNTGSKESQFAMLKRLELSWPEQKKLMSYCRKKKIIFASSAFDEESVDSLNRAGMGIFKIPSGEITNKPLIQHISRKRKPIILSTGMSYLREIQKAINWINETWDSLGKRYKLTLLHCVSDYPVAYSDANLLAIRTLKNTFGLPVGYSDHAVGVDIAIAAVGMGAEVIEKHFTLDRNMKGPDHKASLEPAELKLMAGAIRNIEQAFGDGIKRLTKNEIETRKIIRRSLAAARDIRAGEVIRRCDIKIKRPGTGMPPESTGQLINKKARVNVKKDSLLAQNKFF